MTFYNVVRAKMTDLHHGLNPDTYFVLLSMTDAYLFMIELIYLTRSQSKTDHFAPWDVASQYIFCEFNSTNRS